MSEFELDSHESMEAQLEREWDTRAYELVASSDELVTLPAWVLTSLLEKAEHRHETGYECLHCGTSPYQVHAPGCALVKAEHVHERLVREAFELQRKAAGN